MQHEGVGGHDPSAAGYPSVQRSSGMWSKFIPWIPAVIVGTATIATQAEILRMPSFCRRVAKGPSGPTVNSLRRSGM